MALEELPPPQDNLDETAAVEVDLDPSEVLPFDDDPEPTSARLTLEQYASLCAELPVAPDDPHVAERYGIGSTQA